TKVHSNLNQAIEPQIKSLIENILSVKVLDLLSDAAIDTARTGIIVVLSDTPTVRNPEAIPKVKK
ncbi:MAG: Na-translocating system protein MpsC family protein, partial [Cyanobacteria bacterium J06621_11]